MGLELTTEWRDQFNDGADGNVDVDRNSGATAADFSGHALGLKRITGSVGPLDFKRKLDRNSWASGPL